MKTVSTHATGVSSEKMLDVQGVAQLLNCSTRHVYRLSDAGRMPTPIKLGALCRWSKSQIEDWISAGCPVFRNASNWRTRTETRNVLARKSPIPNKTLVCSELKRSEGGDL